MPESEEEKKKRWAAAAAMSYMTPAMSHALSMSKQQSQNKYKEKFDKTKGKGFTSVASTPEIENAKKQSNLISQTKYKSEFEKNKAKFTQVADDPETRRVSRVSKQISNLEYQGKKSASTRSKKRRDNVNLSPSTTQQSTSVKESEVHSSPEKTNDQQMFDSNEDLSYGGAEESIDQEKHFPDDADENIETSDNFREDPQTLESDVNDYQSNDDITSHDDDNKNNDVIASEGDECCDLESNDATASHGDDYQYEDVNLPHGNDPTNNDGSYEEGVGVETVNEKVSNLAVDEDHQTREVEKPENSLDDFYANLE